MLFLERAIGPRWLAFVGVFTLVFLALVTVISVPVLVVRGSAAGWWLVPLLSLAFVFLLGVALILLVRRLTVVVSETHVDAYVSPLRVMHIPLGVVRGVEVTEITLREAGGIGWRAAGSHQYLLWSAGAAVRLTLKNGGSRALRSERAQELNDVIASLRKRDGV